MARSEFFLAHPSVDKGGDDYKSRMAKTLKEESNSMKPLRILIPFEAVNGVPAAVKEERSDRARRTDYGGSSGTEVEPPLCYGLRPT